MLLRELSGGFYKLSLLKRVVLGGEMARVVVDFGVKWEVWLS